MHHPLEQFIVRPILNININGLNISFTNSSLVMLLAFIVLCIIGLVSTTGNIAANQNKVETLLPNRMRVAMEALYEMTAGTVYNTTGEAGKKYVPFIFTLYSFLLILNLGSMLPGNFTVTSHIIITFGIAAFVFIGVTLIGFIKHGWHYLRLFAPQGTPLMLLPLIFIVELFAYLARPISLSLRLAANMTAGHIMLKVIASLIIIAGMFGILPLILLILLTGFEIFIAVLQAYVFTVLSCVYLNDALNLH